MTEQEERLVSEREKNTNELIATLMVRLNERNDTIISLQRQISFLDWALFILFITWLLKFIYG